MMKPNAEAITIFCSHLCVGEGVSPLEPKEWSALAQRLMAEKLQPADLLEFGREDFRHRLQYTDEQTDRMLRLMDRSASLGFAVSQYEAMGISLITRADAEYPARLKQKLGHSCPPIFYAAGKLSLLNQGMAGYAGARNIAQEDMAFAQSTVRKTVEKGFAVVSGGARGIDQTAEQEALSLGSCAAAFLSDSLLKRLKDSHTVQAIQQGRLLLLSAVKPDAGFNTGIAMARNKYIYAQANGAIIVKSDLNKGGTWSGAVENLRHGWCPTFCWNRSEYSGNAALIQKGAIPIDESWDGSLFAHAPQADGETFAQLSIFDL